MNGLNQSTSPNLELVKTALDKLRDDTTQAENIVQKATALHPLVFTQDSADKAAVVTDVIGGGGYFDSSVDDFVTIKNAAKKAPAPQVTRIANFAQNLAISRTFMADQQQSAVAKSVRQATQAWIASRDRNAMAVYALGFTTQNTIDSTTLFSDTHTNQNGDTVDNKETGAISDSVVNNVVVSLRGQINQTGVLVGYEPKFMLTSSAGHHDGVIYTKSVLRAGTGNNDLNYFSELYPGMEVVYNPHLDATSTTAFFVGTSGHDVMRFEREAFFSDLVDWKVNVNDQYVYKLRAREAVDSISYVGVVGCTGS